MTESPCAASLRPPGTRAKLLLPQGRSCHAARLSGKRLLALWNAFPGVEKQTKVGDRDTLIDQLWSAIEALPDPDPPSDTKRPSKQEEIGRASCRERVERSGARV